MRGPLVAAAVAAAFLMSSLVIGVPLVTGLLLIISGATIALVTLRQGARVGLRVIGMAALAAAVARFAATGQGLPVFAVCGVVWLPVWLMAVALRRSQQQAQALLIAAVHCVAYALTIRAVIGDVEAFWLARLWPLLTLLAERGAYQFDERQVELIASALHVWSLVVLMCALASMLMLGRSWQAGLYNPGGFGPEFRELRLPRVLNSLAVLVAVLFVADQSGVLELPLGGDAFVILVVLFAFQGLAVIHYRTRALSMSTGWLTGMYVLLVLMPHIVGPALATTGLADNISNLRKNVGLR